MRGSGTTKAKGIYRGVVNLVVDVPSTCFLNLLLKNVDVEYHVKYSQVSANLAVKIIQTRFDTIYAKR